MHIFSLPPFFIFFSFVWQFLYCTFLMSFGVACIATSFDYIQVMYWLSRDVLKEKFLAELFVVLSMWF